MCVILIALTAFKCQKYFNMLLPVYREVLSKLSLNLEVSGNEKHFALS